MFCSDCGASIKMDDKFCFKCGSRVKVERVEEIAALPHVETAATYSGGIPVHQTGPIQYVQPRQMMTSDTRQYAGFWVRFGAMLIDQFVWFIMAVALLVLPIEESLAVLLLIIISWLYYAMLESSSWQGTIGKLACGIVVSDLDGNRISFMRATGRYVGHILSGFFYIGYLMVAFTDKKRGLHDFMAGTIVYYKRSDGDGR